MQSFLLLGDSGGKGVVRTRINVQEASLTEAAQCDESAAAVNFQAGESQS